MPPLAVSTMTGSRDWPDAASQNFQPVHVGHHQIEQHEGDLVAARPVQEIERGLSAGRGHDLHPAARDRGFEQAALHGIVVDDENGLRHPLPW